MISFDEAFDISLGEVVDATVESVEQGSIDPLVDLFTGGDDEGGEGESGEAVEAAARLRGERRPTRP